MLQTFGLTHLNLPVKNIEESQRFYQTLFDMKEIRRFDNTVMLRTSGTHEVLTLSLSPEHADQLAKMERFHFGFRLREAMNIDEVMAEIVRLGGKEIEKGGSREKGRLYAFAHDPNGYALEVFWEND